MFCIKCGKQIEDNSNVCPYCGSTVKKSVTVENNIMAGSNVMTGNNVTYESNNKFEKIFVEPDENYIGSLGNGYLNSFLTAQKIKRCVVLLSDKRVYLRGNMIDNNSGKIKRINMQKTIDLEDITGTGFIYTSIVWKLFLSILCFIITIVIIPSLFFAILLLVSYIKDRRTLFFIEYAGGCIKFDASIYGLAESQDFEKQIRRAKNKVKDIK